jgi:predicted Zn-ribbon and HTH transcriptional regulator
MGLLRRLLGRDSSVGSVRRPTSVAPLILRGNETLEVVGESHYQRALWLLVGGDQGERVRVQTVGVLSHEPENPEDENAIQVLIKGHLVGYLSREDAALYLAGLKSLVEQRRCPIGLQGVIVGGGWYADGRGMLGVFLDHDPTDFGLRPHQVVHVGQLRTGLSEAISTDLDDDSYDLSWLSRLSGTHNADDISVLRGLLQGERDPIDRHFMLSELSRCLYKARDTEVRALDDFDQVCFQHYAEMDVIRPALLEKFGQIPLVEMFRQASIRCQKAHDWPATAQWAERGLSFYGTEAARPEVVDDLRKRLAHAQSKMTAELPRTTRIRSEATRTDESSGVETLSCTACGSSFQRPRSRGRRPNLCPACRSRLSTAGSAASNDP